MKDIYKELDALCREQISMYDEKVAIAWDRIDQMRCPLWMADEPLYNEMLAVVEDYCWDNDLDIDDIDIEEIIGA